MVSTQKLAHTFFLVKQNIDNKQERFKIDYENDYCEVIEHHIDKTEHFHLPYPYERFDAYQLPNLEKESLIFYKKQLKL